MEDGRWKIETKRLKKEIETKKIDGRLTHKTAISHQPLANSMKLKA